MLLERVIPVAVSLMLPYSCSMARDIVDDRRHDTKVAVSNFRLVTDMDVVGLEGV